MLTVGRMLRVLVVDDNQLAADTLAKLLSGLGHQVEVAYDASAIELAQGFRPDVVLLDINLPKTDGISVAQSLREQEGGKEALIIAVTGYDDALYRLLAKEAGIDHYLVKPVDTAALERLLRRKSAGGVEEHTGTPDRAERQPGTTAESA
jgi:CheY-like chemotaxis protein